MLESGRHQEVLSFILAQFRTLLADKDQEIIKRFDLLKQKTMYGKPVTGVERTTFVIGPDGRLLHTFANVKPQGHAEEVLALLGAGKAG